MRTSQLLTVSLPPGLLKKAEKLAKKEHRTKSELVREALRQYLAQADLSVVQRREAKKRVFTSVDRIQERTGDLTAEEVERIVAEAVKEVRAQKRKDVGR